MGQRGHSQAAFLTNRQYALNSLTARKTILFELSIRVSYNFRKVVDIKGDHLIEWLLLNFVQAVKNSALE